MPSIRVMTRGGIARRRRAGLDFGDKPITVELVKALDPKLDAPDEISGARPRYVVDAEGMEAIKSDNALIMIPIPDGFDPEGDVGEALSELQADLDERDREIAALRDRIADLEADALELRAELGRRPRAEPTGGPERLAPTPTPAGITTSPGAPATPPAPEPAPSRGATKAK